MEPITRAQLQNASATAIAARMNAVRREQELRGQLAAEELYKEVRRIAALGGWTTATSKPMEPGIAFDMMLKWTKEHFPDCEVSVTTTCAVRVDWSVLPDDPKTVLEDRRLEKETSW